MLYAYLVSAIVGAVLLGVSLVGGDHHGGDAHGGGDHQHDGDSALAVFSLRVWTYILGFGGLCGLLLRWVGSTSELVTALISAGVGVSSAVGARLIIGRAARPGLSGTVNQKLLVGRGGEVLLPFKKGQTGKIRLRVQEQDVDLLATTDEEDELGAKDEVLVVDMKDGCAQVARNPAAQKRLREGS